MESYAYRENLESILAFTHNRRAISLAEAAEYLGFRDVRTIRKRCPQTFVNGWGTVESFAKELCGGQKGGRRK